MGNNNSLKKSQSKMKNNRSSGKTFVSSLKSDNTFSNKSYPKIFLDELKLKVIQEKKLFGFQNNLQSKVIPSNSVRDKNSI